MNEIMNKIFMEGERADFSLKPNNAVLLNKLDLEKLYIEVKRTMVFRTKEHPKCWREMVGCYIYGKLIVYSPDQKDLKVIFIKELR